MASCDPGESVQDQRRILALPECGLTFLGPRWARAGPRELSMGDRRYFDDSKSPPCGSHRDRINVDAATAGGSYAAFV